MSVKIGHFSHVFHMVFHIHTPSSVLLQAFSSRGIPRHSFIVVLLELTIAIANLRSDL